MIGGVLVPGDDGGIGLGVPRDRRLEVVVEALLVLVLLLADDAVDDLG